MQGTTNDTDDGFSAKLGSLTNNVKNAGKTWDPWIKRDGHTSLLTTSSHETPSRPNRSPSCVPTCGRHARTRVTPQFRPQSVLEPSIRISQAVMTDRAHVACSEIPFCLSPPLMQQRDLRPTSATTTFFHQSFFHLRGHARKHLRLIRRSTCMSSLELNNRVNTTVHQLTAGKKTMAFQQETV